MSANVSETGKDNKNEWKHEVEAVIIAQNRKALIIELNHGASDREKLNRATALKNVNGKCVKRRVSRVLHH